MANARGRRTNALLVAPRGRVVLSRRRFLRSATVAGVGGGLIATLHACGGSQMTGGQGTNPVGATDFSARFAGFEVADEPNGDLARVVWPGWMDRLDAEVRRLYEFQVVNGDLMRWMPCFCGCHREDGHRNNRDCYVEAVNPDGSVIFDSMAPT